MLNRIRKYSLSFLLLLTASSGVLAVDSTDLNPLWWADSGYPIWSVIPAGDLDVGESVTKTIYANRPWNNTAIHLRENRKYKFTVASPAWNNGEIVTDAGGYSTTNNFRRHSEYKMMALVGEIHRESKAGLATYTGTKFLIGLGRDSYTAPRSGYLVALANDCLGLPPYTCYLDNSRVVTLTVKRLE